MDASTLQSRISQLSTLAENTEAMAKSIRAELAELKSYVDTNSRPSAPPSKVSRASVAPSLAPSIAPTADPASSRVSRTTRQYVPPVPSQDATGSIMSRVTITTPSVEVAADVRSKVSAVSALDTAAHDWTQNLSRTSVCSLYTKE